MTRQTGARKAQSADIAAAMASTCNAALIGEVTEDAHHFVQMRTRFGGRRIVDWLAGDQLPRIC